jgi:hypothetical protein
MSRDPTISIAAMILVAAASMSSARLACQAAPVTPQEPPTLDEFFRVDRATGAPTPLERMKMQKVAGPVQKGGIQMVESYIEGVASPVQFKAGEPQQFVIRLMSPGDSQGKDLTAAEVRLHFGLGPLLVQQFGRKSVVGRFATTTFIPFGIESFGQSTLGLDPKNPARPARSFLLTPNVPLAPGHYQIWIGGFHNFDLVRNPFSGMERWAFDIVAR